MPKVLIIGNSAATLACARAYHRAGCELYSQGEALNPGLNEISKAYNLGGLADFESLRAFAEKVKPDLVFIGPPDPLATGVVDFFEDELHIPAVGPRKASTILESSKAFTRDLVEKYQIPGQIRFKTFSSMEGVREFAEELGGDFVVKADGLKAGMGVKVSGDHFATIEEGLDFAKECIDEAGRVVIEEKLLGEEFSLMSFCDGTSVLHLPAVQDFKRALENDKGPNTGGMGAYIDRKASLPFLKPEELDEAKAITQKVMEAMNLETGVHFKGILFGGFMCTAKGLRLLEYNVRTGDPETVVALSVLKTDFYELSRALVEGRLNEIQMELEDQSAVGKYLVPEGYPELTHDGAILTLPELPEGVELITAWVEKEENAGPHTYRMIQGGSVGHRAGVLLAKGNTLDEASQKIEAVCTQIKGPFFHRSDIATSATITKKLARMEELRKGA